MPVWIKNRKGTPELYGRITLPSGKFRSKKCASEREAIQWEENEKAKLEKDPFSMPIGTVSLLALANAYLDNIAVRHGQGKSYKEKLRVIERLCQDIDPKMPVVRVTYGMIERHCNRIAKEVSGHRANKTRVHLKAMYTWGIKALKLPYPNPWLVDRYREEKTPRYVPQDEDFWAVVDAAKGQDKRMIQAAFHLAARKSELFEMTWEDVDFQSKKVRLWTNKRGGGREYDWLPLEPELEAILREQRRWLADTLERLSASSDYVWYCKRARGPFVQGVKIMGRLCALAKVKPFGFHAIRHLAACKLDEANEPLAYIQMRLRHKNATTTSTYLRSLRGLRPSKALKRGKVIEMKGVGNG